MKKNLKLRSIQIYPIRAQPENIAVDNEIKYRPRGSRKTPLGSVSTVHYNSLDEAIERAITIDS
jgi:hypothetical protein